MASEGKDSGQQTNAFLEAQGQIKRALGSRVAQARVYAPSEWNAKSKRMRTCFSAYAAGPAAQRVLLLGRQRCCIIEFDAGVSRLFVTLPA